MKNSKLANRNGDGAQIGRSASSAQQDQVSAVKVARQESGSEEDSLEKN